MSNKESMSNIEVRKINKKSIVDALFEEGSLTKAEITAKVGLSLATVNVLLKELLDENIVEQGEILKSTGGRRPTQYNVNENHRVAVGITLSRHHIRIAYVNWTCGVKDVSSTLIKFENTDSYWQFLRNLVTEFMAKNHLEEEKLYGIGVSFPARIINSGSIEDIEPADVFKEVDFQKIKDMFRCRVLIVEAIKAAGFSHIGTMKQKNRCIYIHLAEDVGGAVIADGDFGGLSNRTASFADVYVSPEFLSDADISEKSYFERSGTFGKVCNRSALLGDDCSSLKEFFEILDEGSNEVYKKRWDRYIRALAWMVHTLRVIYDANIVIGGEVSSFINDRKEKLFELLQDNDIYGEEMNYVRFSIAKEFDCSIGTGFITLFKMEEFYGQADD